MKAKLSKIFLKKSNSFSNLTKVVQILRVLGAGHEQLKIEFFDQFLREDVLLSIGGFPIEMESQISLAIFIL